MFSKITRFFSKVLEKTDHVPPRHTDQPASNTLESHVQDLIAASQTATAIQLLIDMGHSHAILLKSQWDQGTEQYNSGRIQFKNWTMSQNRINYAVLCFFKKEETVTPVPLPQAASPVPETPITEQQRADIKQMINEHKVQAALDQCHIWGAGFLMMHARYTAARRQWLMGMIDEEEWILLQQQVEDGIRMFLDDHPGVENEQ